MMLLFLRFYGQDFSHEDQEKILTHPNLQQRLQTHDILSVFLLTTAVNLFLSPTYPCKSIDREFTITRRKGALRWRCSRTWKPERGTSVGCKASAVALYQARLRSLLSEQTVTQGPFFCCRRASQ